VKRQLTKPQKILVLIAAVIAGFYFYLNSIYDPVMNEYERVSAELVSLREEVIGQDLAAGSRTLQARIGRGRQEVVQLEERSRGQAVFRKARSEREVTAALAEIKRLAINSGMEVVKLESKPAPKETAAASTESGGREEETGAMVMEGAGEFAWREYHLVCEGDFFQLIRFLEGKRKAEYLVLIKDARIEYGKDAGGDGDKAAASEIPEITMGLLI